MGFGTFVLSVATGSSSPTGMARTTNYLYSIRYVDGSHTAQIAQYNLGGSLIQSSSSINGTTKSDGGIAATDTYVFFVETSSGIGRILASNLNASTTDIISAGANITQVSSPRGMFATDTALYIADTGNNKVLITDFNGTRIGNFGSIGVAAGQFSSPSGIWVANGYIYVADSGNNRIQIFDQTTYTPIGQFGTAGAGDGQLSSPRGVAADSFYVYVSDTGNNRIQRFQYNSLTGSYDFVDKFGTVGASTGQFNTPAQISVTANNVYVADKSNNRFQIFGNALPTYLTLAIKPQLLTGITTSVLSVKPQITSGSPGVIHTIKPQMSLTGWIQKTTVDLTINHLTMSATMGPQSTNLVIKPTMIITMPGIVKTITPSMVIGMTGAALSINPSITAYMVPGNSGDIDLVLDHIGIVAGSTASGQAHNIKIPDITLEGTGALNLHGTATIQTPLVTVEGRSGGFSGITVSAINLSATGTIHPVGIASLNVPTPVVSGTGLLRVVGTASISVPNIKSVAIGLPATAGVSSISVTDIKIQGHGVLGYSGNASITLPALITDPDGIIDGIGTGTFDVQSIFIDGSGHITPVTVTYTGVVMNLETRAVTEYSNYNFNSLAELGGVCYGAATTGIYSLTGTTDSGTAIPASFQMGTYDMATGGVIERAKEAYVAGNTTGSLTLTITEDETTSNSYNLTPTTTNSGKQSELKAKFGKGTKGRYNSFSIANVSGSSFDIDEVVIKTQPIPRKVR